MKLTDVFIERPVLAAVLSLLILLLGARALLELPIRQYPALKTSTITVSTAYSGASAELIQGFITAPLQQAVAGAEGIDYLTAQSQQGVSSITANIRLNYDPNQALTNIMSKVAQARGQLPRESDDPVIQQGSGDSTALLYISFFSDTLSAEQITDYLERVVQPKLQTVSGVAGAQILGAKTFAMRIWLDPQKMAALGVIPSDAVNALLANNFQAAVGQTKGAYVTLNINAHTDLEDVEGFRQIVVASRNGALIRLQDIAAVELGAADEDSLVTFNGEPALLLGITATPAANPLEVIDGVRAELPDLQQALPPGLRSQVVYDATEYIREAMQEVARTLVEAGLIVMAVIFLFLGSLRAVLIPVVTIPLSLIGAAFLMLLLGYSLNLLTLLAMVLAIGLVVDDAIIVVENIYRHMHEEGLGPLPAALRGAREIAAPVIAMTITLAAVYAPIGFLGGLTGSLFKEFAFTLAGAVLVSGIIALTLSPMMCSRLLKPEASRSRFGRAVDTAFEGLKNRYQRLLHGSLNYRPVTLVLVVTVLASCYFLYTTTPQELAPTEDQSVIFVSATGPEYANIDYLIAFTRQFPALYRNIPEIEDYFVIDGMGAANTALAGLMLKPWNERTRTQDQVQGDVQQQLGRIAGLQAYAFPLPALPGSGGSPVQFVVNTTADYRTLYEVAERLKDAADRSGLFAYVDSDLKFTTPQLELYIDRDKAGELGITMQDIGTALGIMLGGGNINYFALEGRSYQVIPQVPRPFRFNPDRLKEYYVRTAGGALVPLATLVTLKRSVQPSTLNQFQQLNAATLQGVMSPGTSLGQGLAFLQQKADELFPEGFGRDYAGESRQYIQEGQALLYTFFFALVVIYLVLAAQFESFRDPLIVLIGVPLSICGALIPLNLGFATLNIYTQVGLVTLIGLISKHGILLVEFANELQQTQGLDRRQAVEKAAAVRLRPILMTTAAMVMGVLPLVFASGAGAASRFAIGLVIATGMTIGTLFTLFVVPAMYTLIAVRHGREPAGGALQQPQGG